MRQLSLNVDCFGHLDDSKIIKPKVLVDKWPSYWKPHLIWAIDQKIFSLSLKIDRKMTFTISILKIFFQKKFFP